MSEFTPGPWVADCDGVIMPEHGTRWHIASVLSGWPHQPGVNEAGENARLIAAAPDLLEALIKLERQCVQLYRAATPGGNYGANRDGRNLNQSAFADNDPAVQGARAAIAKATGKDA